MTDPLIPSLVLFSVGLIHALMINGWKEGLRNAVLRSNDVLDPVPVDLRISVVIPVRNGGDTLAPLLQDLHAQDINKNQFRVIVVDDHSEDATASIVQGMMRTWPELHLLRSSGTGKKAALTTGVAAAPEGIVIPTDADGRCGPERVRLIAAFMGLQALDLLLLPVRTTGRRGFLGRLQEEEQAGLLGLAMGTALAGRPMLAYGANMAFTKAAFNAVGGVSGDRFVSGDDVFLLQRMRQARKRIAFLVDQRALVSVSAESTWSAFWAQRLRWAGKMRGMRGILPWSGLLSAALPWLLLIAMRRFDAHALFEGHAIEAMLLLMVTWLLWLVPPVSLTGEVRNFLGQPKSPVITALCYAAFTVYAPLTAVLSLFVRPRWKGRRT